jgi:hypothetical protein
MAKLRFYECENDLKRLPEMQRSQGSHLETNLPKSYGFLSFMTLTTTTWEPSISGTNFKAIMLVFGASEEVQFKASINICC